MKKVALSCFLFVVFAIYAVYQNLSANRVVYTAVIPSSTPVTSVEPTTAPTSTPSPTLVSKKPNPSRSPSPSGIYKDGEYIGSVADAYYGNIQVKAVVANGRLADVQFLQYPNDRRTSVQINTEAMPILKSEAITAQSGKVNVVSGATDSSGAFVRSLTSALSQAQL